MWSTNSSLSTLTHGAPPPPLNDCHVHAASSLSSCMQAALGACCAAACEGGPFGDVGVLLLLRLRLEVGVVRHRPLPLQGASQHDEHQPSPQGVWRWRRRLKPNLAKRWRLPFSHVGSCENAVRYRARTLRASYRARNLRATARPALQSCPRRQLLWRTARPRVRTTRALRQGRRSRATDTRRRSPERAPSGIGATSSRHTRRARPRHRIAHKP